MPSTFHLNEQCISFHRRDARQQSSDSTLMIHGCDTAPTPTGFAEIISYDFPLLHAQGSITTEILRCQENFACVRIFYWGSRRKTGHVDVTAIWRERTGN
jgi:hypothetical protein